MARPFLSVIIPAYNEAERLPLTLIDLDRHLSQSDYSYEIIVVNDCSTDGTSSIVAAFIPAIKYLKRIDSPEHRGKGAAVRIGMVAAKGNWRLILDADNSFSVTEFNRILPFLTAERRVDIAVGSRKHSDTEINPSLSIGRRLAETALNRLMKSVFRSEINDFLLGFQCFSAESAEKVFSLTKIDTWSYGAEAIVLGERLGLRVAEVAVIGGHRPGSHFEAGDYLRSLAETIKIWWCLREKKYDIPLFA